ncbi:MAG: response regulator transcription factor [Pleurocapsa sp.]
MTKIIIVDDQISIREFLKINLASEPDFQLVGWAENGQSAINQVEKHQPDIVLMDIDMPTMNGIVATQIISQRFANTKVILFTSKDDRQQLNLALKAGARGYVLKNTSPQDISQIIRLTEKGFFQIGPILTDWNYSESITTAPYESQQKTSLIETSTPSTTRHHNSSTEMYKTADMQEVLSNLTSGIFKLQETIQSQENTIVQLTDRYATVQQEIQTKLNDKRLLNNFKTLHNRARKAQLNLTNRRQNFIFISSFLLGVLTVSVLIALIVGLQIFIP